MRLGKDVDPQALRRFREARGMTHEQLADVVGASSLEVAAWEDGSVRVPREQARRLRKLDTLARREAAIAAAALPGCPWADAHAPGLHAMLLDNPHYLDPLSQETRSHVDGCPACARVLDFGRGLVHLKSDPGLGTDLSGSLERGFDTMPRSVLYLLVIGGGTALAAGSVGWVLRGESVLAPLADSGWMDAARTALSGGVAFAAAAIVLRRLLPRWPYLAGMLSGAAAVLAGTAAWVLPEFWEHRFSNAALLGLLFLTMLIGVLAGRWNAENPWDDGDEAGQVEADPGRLASPDPLRDLREPDAAVMSLSAPPIRAGRRPRP